MKNKNLFFSQDFTELDESETQHIRVLRLSVGSEIALTNGKGDLALAQIIKIDKKKTLVRVIETSHIPKSLFGITLAIAPTKDMHRIQWLIEKCTEIGVQRVQFLKMNHSERKEINLSRLKSIMVAALKQSERVYMPQIEPIIEWKKFLECDFGNQTKLIAHKSENVTSKGLITELAPFCTLVVGAEGGISAQELEQAQEKGFQRISLSNHRLRTETAALVACSFLQTILESTY